MKLLYLSKTSFNNKYRSLFKSLGIESFQYTNPLKTMDNLGELEPDIIYMVKEDFPRFWKMILSSIRERRSIENSLFILEGVLDSDEREAFDYLKGSLILDDSQSIDSFKRALLDFNNREIRRNIFYPESGELCIGYVKSDDFSFINGTIKELTKEELIIIPESIDDIKETSEGDEIINASISREDTVVNVDLIVKHVSETLYCRIKEKNEEYINLVNKLFV